MNKSMKPRPQVAKELTEEEKKEIYLRGLAQKKAALAESALFSFLQNPNLTLKESPKELASFCNEVADEFVKAVYLAAEA